MSLVQSAIRVLTSAGQSSGTLGSCSRPRFTGVVRVTICSGRRQECRMTQELPVCMPTLRQGQHEGAQDNDKKQGLGQGRYICYITSLSRTPSEKMSACRVVTLIYRHMVGSQTADCKPCNQCIWDGRRSWQMQYDAQHLAT